jgi:hypothetical protein
VLIYWGYTHYYDEGIELAMKKEAAKKDIKKETE